MTEPVESGFAIGFHTLDGKTAIAIASAVPGHTMWHRFSAHDARCLGKSLIDAANAFDALEARQAVKTAEQKPNQSEDSK